MEKAQQKLDFFDSLRNLSAVERFRRIWIFIQKRLCFLFGIVQQAITAVVPLINHG